MKYIKITEAAEKWGITPRRVRALAAEGKIPGATRMGKVYRIPAGAPKPPDGRRDLPDSAVKISDMLATKSATLSFEVFPPKNDSTFDSVRLATEEIAELRPDFMSVTYGAGGSTEGYTAEIAANLTRKFNVTTVAHLTCVHAKAADLHNYLNILRKNGIGNVLALRGDIPAGEENTPRDFAHASDLVREIRLRGDFCIGCACYPEGHPESKNQKEDIESLRIKAEMGCDFLTTQMFFDNDIFYNFLFKVREAGIRVPVIAGIMPVTNAAQIRRIMSLSGNALPPRFLRIVDRFGDKPAAMKQAGIAYATEQIIDLYANGVKAAHVYSMNHSDVAAAIRANLKDILD